MHACVVLGPSLRCAEQVLPRALGGAWFAPATTSAPHHSSLRRPFRSCRSNQSSPDRLTNLVVNQLTLCSAIEFSSSFWLTLVLAASSCLDQLLLRHSSLVPTCTWPSIVWIPPPATYLHLLARLASAWTPTVTASNLSSTTDSNSHQVRTFYSTLGLFISPHKGPL